MIDPVIVLKYLILVAYIYHHNKQSVSIMVALIRMFMTTQFRKDMVTYFNEVQRDARHVSFDEITDTIQNIMDGYFYTYYRPLQA